MANKKKRLERELTLVREREVFKHRFKREKEKRKDGQKTFLETILKTKNPKYFKGMRRKKEYISLFRKIRTLNNSSLEKYRFYLELLKTPKPLFSETHYYHMMADAFIRQAPCRSFETWRMPKSKDDRVIFKSLFCHLLVPYKIPPVVDNMIYPYLRFYLSALDIDVMFHLIKGKGIHRFPKLGLEMNSKMNFLLNHAPSHFDLPKAMWWAKIKSMGVSYSIASKLVDNTYIEINTTWPNWYDDFIFFLNRFPKIEQGDLKKILDFIIAQKNNGINFQVKNYDEDICIDPLFPDFSFKGRTIASVLKHVEKWRTYVQVIKESGVNGEFKISPILPMRIKEGKRLIRIRQITNMKKLALEGSKMNHCVATYADECLQGNSSIWSMCEILGIGKVKRLITIEVEEKTKKISQASGNSNRSLHEIEQKWLKMWGEKEALEMELFE